MRPFHALALVGSVVLSACAPQAEDKPVDTGVEAAFDLDGDGFGAPADCDDSDRGVNPLVRDVAGDGLDVDCDGVDGIDRDRDGVASIGSGGNDCDDESPARAPGLADAGVDGIDQDCSGVDGPDADGDGVAAQLAGGSDCDDTTANVHPGVPDDSVDGIDQDCSGLDGDDAAPVVTDRDGDGYDDAALGGVDCDDRNAARNPAATDLVGDGVDQNCDGLDGFDGDGDDAAAGWSGGRDCDDTAAGVHPGAEDASTDGVDQDCSGVDGVDADGDGYAASATGGTDCDDTAAVVNPAAWDTAQDGVDDDCSGADANHAPAPVEDLDGDGFADTRFGGADCDDHNAGINPRVTDLVGDDVDQDCDGVDGTDADADGVASQNTGGADCDDGDAGIAPGLPDRTVDGVDQDCSGLDGSAGAPPVQDVDGDGFVARALGGDDCDDADPGVNVAVFDRWGDGRDVNCDGADGHDDDGDGVGAGWALGPDCDDSDAQVGPFATDVLVDGHDVDCDGFDGRDSDGDGEAAAFIDTLATGGADCDDSRADVNTRAVDATVDQRDQDCDGVDGNDAPPPRDDDRDGFVAVSAGGDDCDDANPAVNPRASDLVGDSTAGWSGDQNCDGIDGTDSDRDGVAAIASGGTDCDDAAATVCPGAADTVGDARDQDCDGVDGVDADGDRWASLASGGADCDDAAAGVHPAASDRLGDSLDEDCDGLDGVDADGDGIASVTSGGMDCDDLALDAHPGAADTAGDARDQDCDGVDGVDGDRDGAASLASGGTDCDDTRAGIHPGAADATADGIDQDCVGGDANDAVRDADGDGFASVAWNGPDCDDGNAAINPAATDLVGDGRDQDCDGRDGVDTDGDGFASAWSGGADCDDDASDDGAGVAAASVHPGSLLDTLVNGVDEDCDGLDGPDADGDGYADASFGGNDCDDTLAAVHPGAADTSYDGLNQDCAGTDGTGVVRDLDGDGHEAVALGGDDCNDRNAAINPAATDLADDTVDQNCDGADGTDRDGDGVASVVSGGTDCNDLSAAVNPAQADVAVDGIDQDCSGLDGVDADGDGFASELSGGSDCDDSDADVSPAGFDLWVDGTDQDCNDVDGDGIEPAGADEDRDGFVSEAEGGRDCDDHRSGISPVATDMWGDDLDQNCDGMDGTDADRDGQISVASGGLDCADGDPTVYAGAAWRERVEREWTAADGDSLVFEMCTRDEDGDGWGDSDYLSPRQHVWVVGESREPRRGRDCDDSAATVAPHLLDLDAHDGVDVNCDGADADDNDGDGYIDVAVGGDDCGDSNARVHPDRLDPLVCGYDQDDDGYVGSLWWPDSDDGDTGYVNTATDTSTSTDGAGWGGSGPTGTGGTTACDTGMADTCAGCVPAHPPTDCMDNNPDVYPGSLPNEGPTVCAPDFDGDGWGSEEWGGSDCVDWGCVEGACAEEERFLVTMEFWDGPESAWVGWQDLYQYAWMFGGTDGSPWLSAFVHPDAALAEPALCTQDADGDGFGGQDLTVDGYWAFVTGEMVFGFYTGSRAVLRHTGMDAGADCDDDDAGRFPDAAENEAPGTCSLDRDGDGWGDSALGGHDCDDNDAGVVPHPETCNDQDDDCDGMVDNDTTDADGDGFSSCNDCDDTNPQQAYGEVTWSPVWSHDLSSYPGGDVYNGGWMYQDSAYLYGRQAWVQYSDWNRIWIPVTRSGTGLEAVEVDVYVPAHAAIQFFPRTAHDGDNGYNFVFVEGWGGGASDVGYNVVVHHVTAGTGTSTDTSYDTLESDTVASDLPALRASSWHRLRVETNEGANTTSLYVDGNQLLVTQSIPLAYASGQDVLLAAYTADCCSNPAGVAWSNLVVYEGVAGADGTCAPDGDRDGFDAIAAGGTDCDDIDPDIRPDSAGLVCGHDRDHDGHVDDADGGTDCDDENAYRYALDDLTGVCGADEDLDGYVTEADGGTDCNDVNEAVRPGAAAREPSLCTADRDGDGRGDASLGDGSAGDTGSGTEYGSAGTDCDDTRAAVNPDASETCNGLDDNCDGVPDEGMPDGDGDGAADCIDCAPGDATISPFRAEVCDSGADNDCDPGTDESNDGDGDGYTLCDGDCDDFDARVHPDRWGQVCGLDADGDGDVRTADGGTDCDDGNGSITGNRVDASCGRDTDRDGYVDWADGGPDCNDWDATVYPGAGNEGPTVCGADNDGDGYVTTAHGGTDCDDRWDAVHPGAAFNEPALCTYDLDGDGWGDRWYAGSDCDDGDAAVVPVPETCNGQDDDCDGVVDDVDADADGVTLCDGDCDDTDAARFPGNEEACDGGVDNDCDATTDENVDSDGDGFTLCQDDCDDGQATMNPAGVDGGAHGDVCDGLDNDCDGLVDETPTCQGCTETFQYGASYQNCAGHHTWYEARDYCQAMGGDLAAAESYGESAYIDSITLAHGGLGWVGAQVDAGYAARLVSGGTFRFSEVYNYWGYEPQFALMHMHTWYSETWAWVDPLMRVGYQFPGEYTRGYTCERPAQTTDMDGDGYIDEAWGGTDCDDANAYVHPDTRGLVCGLDADDDGEVRTADHGRDCDDTNAAAALLDGDPDCDGIVIEPDTLALVPAGSFDMGCTPGQGACEFDEYPVTTVTLTRDVYVATTEVTQGQFEALMGYNPSQFTACGGDCPVERVNWYQAAALANAASEAAGLPACYTCSGSGSDVTCESPLDPYACEGYRLLTEAEWEYAARCGADTVYAGSSNPDDVAWHDGNSGGTTHPVGSLMPNACGLYDMSGNVYEWVNDWWAGYYGGGTGTGTGTSTGTGGGTGTATGTSTGTGGGTGTATGTSSGPGATDPVVVAGTYKSFRGGGWTAASRMSVTNRDGYYPWEANAILGFRLARTAP